MSTPDLERRRRSLRERLRGADSYGLLLLLILASLLLTALAGDQSWGQVAVVTISGATSLFAFWTSRARRLRWAVLAAGLGMVGVCVAVLAGSGTDLDALSWAVVAVLTAASPAVIARRLLQHPRVQGSTVLGALCIYLLFGLFFAYLFAAISIVGGPFFTGQPSVTLVDYLYFSYTTLATVGYGDLTAAGNLGRMLAVSEALIGQLYLVTVVSLLVGNIGRTRVRPPDQP